MIADRDYMRAPEGRNIRVSMALIWILGACFLIQTALTVVGKVPVVGALGLSRAGIENWEVWRLLTFQFLHVVPWPLHVISNALGLYFFGRAVEDVTGPWRFLGVYLAGGVAGGLAQLALNYAIGRSPAASLIGASAGVSAIVAIFCRLHAQQVFSFILFVFPVRMKAITFLLLMVGGSVMGMLFPTDPVAHMAHLGGIALGYFIVPVLHGELPWAGWMGYREPARRVVIPFPRDEVRRPRVAAAPPAEEDDDDFVAREIDPILEKINAQGIQSLTDRERRALERARERIRRS
jgi:membrane associated rhomboid family serine protease